jgi:hypothetical protein
LRSDGRTPARGGRKQRLREHHAERLTNRHRARRENGERPQKLVEHGAERPQGRG